MSYQILFLTSKKVSYGLLHTIRCMYKLPFLPTRGFSKIEIFVTAAPLESQTAFVLVMQLYLKFFPRNEVIRELVIYQSSPCSLKYSQRIYVDDGFCYIGSQLIF